MDKEILIAYMRADVPTYEHQNFINEIQEISETLRVPFKIYINGFESISEKHMSVETRMDMIMSDLVEATTQKTHSVFGMLKENQTYDKVLFACPHEISETLHDVLNRVNGKEYSFKSINIVPISFDPDQKTFSSLQEAKETILIGSKSFESLVEEFDASFTSELRESYLKGKTYAKGDIVEHKHTKLPMTVLECATNYLWVADCFGERKRCWLNEVSKVSSGSIYSFDDSFFGFIPEHINQDEESIAIVSKAISEKTDFSNLLESVKTQDLIAAEKVMQFERRRLALIFAKSVGVSDSVASIPNPEVVVEAALRKLNNVVLTKDGWKILAGLLALLKKVGIDFNENMLNANLRHNLGFIHEGSTLEHELDKLEHNPEILDKEIELIKDAKQLEDMEADVLSEDEKIEQYGFEDSQLYEAISAQERLKRSIRLRSRKTQMAAKRKLALKRYASNSVVNKRARRAAISLIKNKITQGRKNLSIAEKIRIENMIKKRAALVDRVTKKLVPVVRKTALTRLSECVDSIVKAKETVATVLTERYSSFVSDKEILEESIHQILDSVAFMIGDDVSELEKETIKRFKENLQGQL